MKSLKMGKQNEKKSSKKQRREHEVLMGLIELYLKLGKHIGSNTLREHGFDFLSPATIRNYFAELEKEGLLEQAHPSGGRIPTHKAFRLFAEEHFEAQEESQDIRLNSLQQLENRAVTKYLNRATEILSEISGYPAFLSSCRFDHDLIVDIKLVQLDMHRLLCVILTEFGQVLTETLSIENKMSTFALKRIESYFLWKIRGKNLSITLSKEEESLALTLYNEIIVRYLVRYSNFSHEDLYRTGFSKLLAYPELNDPLALTSALSLFENNTHMRLLLSDSEKKGNLSYFIGNDLASYGAINSNCSAITINYCIGHSTVGALGILGPVRMHYPHLFALLKNISHIISGALTHSLSTQKLTYRQPRMGTPYLLSEKGWPALNENKLLEIKEKE